MRRIDTLSALGLAAEIGDFARFGSAEEFMAFVGLVPSEHSPGERRRQGAITKVGNSHVRRLLVESAWHARSRLVASARRVLVANADEEAWP